MLPDAKLKAVASRTEGKADLLGDVFDVEIYKWEQMFI